MKRMVWGPIADFAAAVVAVVAAIWPGCRWHSGRQHEGLPGSWDDRADGIGAYR